jgi:hypothetical protein
MRSFRVMDKTQSLQNVILTKIEWLNDLETNKEGHQPELGVATVVRYFPNHAIDDVKGSG